MRAPLAALRCHVSLEGNLPSRRRADVPPNDCPGICQLTACHSDAVVVSLRCSASDVCRLRACGIFEGARVQVVDGRNGVVLDTHGVRLALGRSLARSISVRPQARAS